MEFRIKALDHTRGIVACVVDAVAGLALWAIDVQ